MVQVFSGRQYGQSLAEYALGAGLIAVVCITGLTFITGTLESNLPDLRDRIFNGGGGSLQVDTSGVGGGFVPGTPITIGGNGQPLPIGDATGGGTTVGGSGYRGDDGSGGVGGGWNVGGTEPGGGLVETGGVNGGTGTVPGEEPGDTFTDGTSDGGGTGSDGTTDGAPIPPGDSVSDAGDGDFGDDGGDGDGDGDFGDGDGDDGGGF